MQLAPYLNFSGNCEAALEFYKQKLNGDITFLMRFGESPMAAEFGPESANKVMHATFSVAGGQFMACDSPPAQQEAMGGFSMSIATADLKEGESYFNALADGGTVVMPFGPTFWAKGFGMLKDKFGVSWMVNCE